MGEFLLPRKRRALGKGGNEPLEKGEKSPWSCSRIPGRETEARLVLAPPALPGFSSTSAQDALERRGRRQEGNKGIFLLDSATGRPGWPGELPGFEEKLKQRKFLLPFLSFPSFRAQLKINWPEEQSRAHGQQQLLGLGVPPGIGGSSFLFWGPGVQNCTVRASSLCTKNTKK